MKKSELKKAVNLIRLAIKEQATSPTVPGPIVDPPPPPPPPPPPDDEAEVIPDRGDLPEACPCFNCEIFQEHLAHYETGMNEQHALADYHSWLTGLFRRCCVSHSGMSYGHLGR